MTGSFQSELKHRIPQIRANLRAKLLNFRRSERFLISYGSNSNASFRSSSVEIFNRFSRRLFMPNSTFKNLYTRIAFILAHQMFAGVTVREHAKRGRAGLHSSDIFPSW